MSLQDNLAAIPSLAIKEKNSVNYYLTFRSHRGKEADYAAVMGELLAIISKRTLKPGLTTDKALKKFIEACTQNFHEKLADPEFEELLQHMYFDDEARGLYQVSPEFLLLKGKTGGASNTRHVADSLGNMLIESGLQGSVQLQNINFLEAELQKEFQSFVTEQQPSSNVSSYLPYMTKVFSEDLAFLCQYPSYLMQNMKAFIGLYNFLYSAQLALNIRSWKSEPVSKPLYFILDTERASTERTHVRKALPELSARVEDLFPMLSALEYLNQPDSKTAHRYPFWRYYQYLDGLPESEKPEQLKQLQNFVRQYREKRKRPVWPETIDTAEAAIKAITVTAKEIFSVAKSNPQDVNKRVVSVFEHEIARHFIQNRKRGGRVLIINQDYLLLLTNLAVGGNSRIQFQKLLDCFKSRGVWFDQQSEQALIEFYERVGNIERMSDSGDAVYVRKTI